MRQYCQFDLGQSSALVGDKHDGLLVFRDQFQSYWSPMPGKSKGIIGQFLGDEFQRIEVNVGAARLNPCLEIALPLVSCGHGAGDTSGGGFDLQRGNRARGRRRCDSCLVQLHDVEIIAEGAVQSFATVVDVFARSTISPREMSPASSMRSSLMPTRPTNGVENS